MPLIKLNNRSIKDVTSLPFGVGNLIHIQSQTASASSSISFTGINGTYKEYQFYFINCHPSSDGAGFEFNLSSDSGSNYNVTKTTTSFITTHLENDSVSYLEYRTGEDLAQSSAFQNLSNDIGSDADQSFVGSLTLFNPSSTTYVKHFIVNTNGIGSNDKTVNSYIAGYGNTTSAINAIRFQFSSGNIDDGTIAMFGVV